jgi:hypothetical protein
MKRTITAIATAALALTIATPALAAPTYTAKQKNQYWRLVSGVTSDAKIVGKASVISFGIATCNLLRSGGTLDDLVEIFGSDPDYAIVEDLVTASIAAAPVVLCKDQQYKFD